MAIANPFSFEAATNLPIRDVLEWYVPDHNQGPLIKSSKNLFLFGERGSGKSMTLRYFSIEAEIARASKENTEIDLDYIGIYVKCNSPLIWKREYELIKRDQNCAAKAALLSEHIFALWIAKALVDQIAAIPNLFSNTEESLTLASRLAFMLDFELNGNENTLQLLGDVLEKRLDEAQALLATSDPGEKFSTFRGFNSLVVQLISRLKGVKKLKDSHFMIMLDDGQDLYLHQREALNSWIAYRDHSAFSLKVAVARRLSYAFTTANGSAILEIHDYSSLDLQTPYQNSSSEYGKFVENVLTTRLQKAGIRRTAKEFFPTDERFENQLIHAQEKIAAQLRADDPSLSAKQISDTTHKRARATVFRERPPQANLPTYAGLYVITEASTGVTRNVLEVAWNSFDLLARQNRQETNFSSIPPSLQSQALHSCSNRLWRVLSEGLNKNSKTITTADAKKLCSLFNQLGIYFQKRLKSNISEPRILSFVVSERTQSEHKTEETLRILALAVEQTLLFSRPYPARDRGSADILYTPNKLLWPKFGLDLVGQSGRASLRVSDLERAMLDNEIPFKPDEKNDGSQMSIDL